MSNNYPVSCKPLTRELLETLEPGACLTALPSTRRQCPRIWFVRFDGVQVWFKAYDLPVAEVSMPLSWCLSHYELELPPEPQTLP